MNPPRNRAQSAGAGIEDQGLLDSLLRAAAGEGHANIVELLIRRGANPYGADAYGMTPVGLACAGGHMYTVRLLLQEGVELQDLRPHDGRYIS